MKMNLIKNVFAAIGAVIVVGMLFVYTKFDLGTRIDQASKLDPNAMGLFMAMGDKVLTTGNAAESMIRRVKINDDVEMEDVVESLKSVAGEHNLLTVGDSLMANGQNGAKYIRILSFCNPSIAKQFIKHSMAYIAFMPCRMAIVEDEKGGKWIYTMDLGLMISGGHPLEPELLKLAKSIETAMHDMQDKAAEGDF
jgi:uncharacterized protein (DUF302 family)